MVVQIGGMSHNSNLSSGIDVVVNQILCNIRFTILHVLLIWIMFLMVRLNESVFQPKLSHILIPGFAGMDI